MKDELQELWALETRPQMTKEDKEMLVQTAEGKLTTLDRRLKAREMREILPGVLAAAAYGGWFVAAEGLYAKLSAAVVVAGVAWISYYLLRHGRGPENPRQDLPLREYRTGVAAKYDHQIWLLSRVRYWYLPPFFLAFVLDRVGDIERQGWTVNAVDWASFGFLIAVSGFIIWLNEHWSVKRLRSERDALAEMLREE